VWLLLVAALLLVIGSMLPWARATAPFIGTVSRSGIDGGDGWISFFIGIVVVIQAIQIIQSRRFTRGHAGVAILLALAAGGLAIYEFSDISNKFSDIHAETSLVTTSYGSGLSCIVAGAVLLLVCGLLGFSSSAA
jgi:hypothetical protein